EEPMHGYQLIREIAQRSAGDWRASPGSVYPTLSQLEDEGLVRAEESSGRRVFQLTAKGRREATDRAEEFAALWQPAEGSDVDGMRELGGLVFQVGAAAMQVASAGTEDQRERAAELLEQARRDLYKLLADEPADTGDESEENQ
ncbi:MAG: PadR family transcriptional regulator, partial [Propionibacteriales bacterium]|nr:PadR family transcriptional regulator [Propionibacteriales bacterium]